MVCSASYLILLSLFFHLSSDVEPTLSYQVCNRQDQARMEALGRLHNAPLRQDCEKFRIDHEAQQVKSAAKALMGPEAVRGIFVVG